MYYVYLEDIKYYSNSKIHFNFLIHFNHRMLLHIILYVNCLIKKVKAEKV